MRRLDKAVFNQRFVLTGIVNLFYPLLAYHFLMKFFVIFASVLVTLAFAYDYWLEERCFQWISILSCFLMTWFYFALIEITDNMRQPFQSRVNQSAEKINPEPLLVAVDSELFHIFNSTFRDMKETKETRPSPTNQLRRDDGSIVSPQKKRNVQENAI